jgi:hypothetical protein
MIFPFREIEIVSNIQRLEVVDLIRGIRNKS